MDNDLLELADRLCSVAGMIMEDCMPIAVRTPKTSEGWERRIETAAVAGQDIVALIAAAKVLVRLG